MITYMGALGQPRQAVKGRKGGPCAGLEVMSKRPRSMREQASNQHQRQCCASYAVTERTGVALCVLYPLGGRQIDQRALYTLSCPSFLYRLAPGHLLSLHSPWPMAYVCVLG